MFLLWTKRNAFEKTFIIKTDQEITGKTTKSKEIFVQIQGRRSPGGPRGAWPLKLFDY